MAQLLPPAAGAGRIGWLMVVLASSLLAFLLVDGLARRLLPVAALLRLTLVFPDRAPSRFRLAMRTTSVKRLREWAEEANGSAEDADDSKTRAQQVLALAGALNAHDRRTRGHSERVRALTELVAEEMRLPKTDGQRLQWAAFLHDIGKLTVPPEILNKPGRPDDGEWRVLQGHPAAGERIAGPLQPWLGEWVDAVSQHHERFDGTGYPHGLAGEEISLAGRIVSVTDAFETMTAVRPYKKPMSAAAAREELVRCAGTHFDPRVVRAFLRVSLGRVRFTAGLAAGVAALPVLGLLPRAAGRASAVAGRTAASAKVAAAVGAIVLGSAVSQVGGTGGSSAPVALGGARAPSGQGATEGVGADLSASSTSLGPVASVEGGAAVADAEAAPPASVAPATGPESSAAAAGGGLSARAQVGQVAVELPSGVIEPRDDFGVGVEVQSGGTGISLP